MATSGHGCIRTAGRSKKPSLVSVGESDSMSRRSGSVKPFAMSRALARRPDAMLSSGFQIRAQRVSIARSRQRSRARAVSSRDHTLAARFLSKVCREADRCPFLLAPQATVHLHRSHFVSFPHRVTRGPLKELHQERMVRVMFQARRLVVSCRHDLLPSLIVQFL